MSDTMAPVNGSEPQSGPPKGLRASSPRVGIDELPAELLLTIIERVLKKVKKMKYYDQLYCFMLVCKAWATLLQDTPHVWTLLDTSCPARLPLVIQRSRSSPLTIERFRMGYRQDREAALFNESWRWGSVKIVQSQSDVDGKLEHQLGRISSAPLLTKLEVVGWGETSRWSYPNLFGGNTPKLQCLILTRFPIHLDSTILDHVRILQLVDIETPGLSFGSFLHILQRCQQLVKLDLRKLTFDQVHQAEDGSSEEPIFSLPNLTHFRLLYLPEVNTTQILTTLRIPSCIDWQVAGFRTADAGGLPGRAAHLDHLIPVFQSILSTSEKATLEICEDEFGVRAFTEGRQNFMFRGNLDDVPMEALELAATQWGLALGTPEVEIRFYYEGEVEWNHLWTVFRTLPRVTTIMFFQVDEETVQAVVERLAVPIETRTGADGNEVRTWPCPNLRSLLCEQTNTSDWTPREFLDMLQRRYSRKPTGIIPFKRPKPLRYLMVSIPEGCDTWHSRQLMPLVEALKPGGKLKWDKRVRDGRFDLRHYDDDIPGVDEEEEAEKEDSGEVDDAGVSEASSYEYPWWDPSDEDEGEDDEL